LGGKKVYKKRAKKLPKEGFCARILSIQKIRKQPRKGSEKGGKMSVASNESKQKSSCVDGIVAVTIVGAALVFSGFNFANAASQPIAEVPTQVIQTVTTSGSAGATVTVSGSAGLTLGH
jgi:hypothetical protein